MSSNAPHLVFRNATVLTQDDTLGDLAGADVEVADGRIVAWDRDAERAGRIMPVAGTGYSLARWQQDASGRWRSSGDRLIAPHEIAALPIETAMRVFKAGWLNSVYDYEVNVAIGEAFAARGRLPMEFMAFSPPAWSEGAWTDVNRMRTLNMDQASAGREKHVCPLQFDIVDRAITRWSNPGEVIFDPFGGLGTVSYCALKLGRQGLSVELNPGYWADSIRFLSAREQALATPYLFDLTEVEEEERAA